MRIYEGQLQIEAALYIMYYMVDQRTKWSGYREGGVG